MSSPETPRDTPESYIEKELTRLKKDRATFLREASISEEELKTIIQRGDVRAMFQLDVETPENQNLSALESISAGVLIAYQSTGNTPKSISEFAQLPLPVGASPEVRFTHWKIREIAKLGPTHPTFIRIDSFWKSITEKTNAALPPRAPKESEGDFLTRAKDFISEHKVAASVIGALGGGTLLYKIFGSDDKKGEGKDGIFKTILDKVPKTGFIGVIVAIIGLWYFRDDIRKWMDRGKETVEVAGKVMDTAKAIAEFMSPTTTNERRIEIAKAIIKQGGEAANAAISAAAKSFGIDMEKLKKEVGTSPQGTTGKGTPEGDPGTGNIAPIALARTSQLYYGTWTPWKDLKPSEKAIIQGSVSHWFSGWFQRGGSDFAQAQGRIPEIESAITTLEGSVSTKTDEILDKLKTGKGTFDGKDWKSIAAIPEIETAIKSAHSGALPVTFDALSDPSKRLIAEHMARQEIDILIQGQKTLKAAIEAGPAEYGRLMLAKGDPALLYDKMRILEASRNGLDLAHIQNITPDDWKRFTKLAEEHLTLMRDKDEILGAKKAKMLELKAEFDGADAARRAAIETEFGKLATEYVEIERDVAKATEHMLTKDSAMARVLSSGNAGLTHASWNPLHHFMVNKGWVAPTKHAESLGDLRLVTPGKHGLLRFGFSKGNFVLMGVGVGLVAYANRSLTSEAAKHDLERMAWGLVPVVGGSMDLKDAWKDFTKGEVLHGFANLGAATASFSGDVLLGLSLIPAGTTAPLGIGAKGALYGLRNALKELGIKEAASVAVKSSDSATGKIVLEITEASGTKVEKVLDLTPEGKKAWSWIQERMAPQREKIAQYSKYGLVGGIGAMLVAGSSMVISSYITNKDGTVQKVS